MSELLTAMRERLLICDGAMGTELQAHGLQASGCPELWNLSHPDAVEAIHRAYCAAGADVILTNSFGGSRFKLEKFNLERQVSELNEAAACVARRAAGADQFVLGDVGPTGELMAPLGVREPGEFEAVFAEQVEGLVRGGVDGIIIETMTAVEEAQAAVRAARSVTDLPVLVSMQFKRDADGAGLHTMMGVDVPMFVRSFAELGVDALGGNCSSPGELADVVKQLREETSLPILAEPNAGVPQLINWKTVFPLGPNDFAEAVVELVRNGVSLLGGCCGTTPEHIRVLASRFRRT